MRDLERIGESIVAALKRLGVVTTADLVHIVNDWERLVGEPWASRSWPVGLNGGELVLEVADGSSATLLKYRVGALLADLEEVLGPGVVGSVRLRVAGPRDRH